MTHTSILATRCYSVQPRDQIFVKGYRFLYFAKRVGISFGKSIVKTSVVNIARNLWIMLSNLQQINLKLLQKESFIKQQKQLVI